MSRIVRTSPVSANMYRHFAIITVVITACLALFVDGENRDAMAERVAKAAQKSQSPSKELPAATKGTHNRLEDGRSQQASSGWGADPVAMSDDSYSYSPRLRTQTNGPSASQSGNAPPLPSMVAGARQGLSVAGLGLPDNANPEKRGKKANPALIKPARKEMEDILRASSERSGSSSEDLEI